MGEYRFCGVEYPLCEAVLGNGIVFWISQREIDGKETRRILFLDSRVPIGGR